MYFNDFEDLYVSSGFSIDEARSEISFVFDILFDFTYKDIILDRKPSADDLRKAEKIFKLRTSLKKPIQQLAGCAFFYGRKFFVNEFTLIPRPETELLAKEVIDLSKLFKNPRLLDIGAGTGCIAETAAIENPHIYADMSDIQIEALETASKNAAVHNILARTSFIHSDLFENIKNKYDIIVSNPPYIPIKDKESLQIEVKNFEPHSALFTDDELGLEFYQRISEKLYNYLNEGGAAAFELGINQAPAVKELLLNAGMKDIKIIKDFCGIERIITARI